MSKRLTKNTIKEINSQKNKAVVKQITYIDENGDEVEFETCIKKHSFKSYCQLISRLSSSDDSLESKSGAFSLLVSNSIFEDEDCKVKLFAKEEDVEVFDELIIFALVNAITEVNERKKKGS